MGSAALTLARPVKGPDTQIDLTDVSGCPVSERCQVCNMAGPVTVRAVLTDCGVVCLSRCAGCLDAGRLPNLGPERALMDSVLHCGHLRITLDQMIAALASTV